MTKTPTVSVRKAHSLTEELWLDKHGKWGDFAQRKRFSGPSAQDNAQKFVANLFGEDFHQFGTFNNS